MPFRPKSAEGPFARGGAGLNPALAWITAVWATHAVLRVIVLFRNDAYGFPFVGKPDWYLFHAWCIDWLWILGWSLPWLILAFAGGAWSKPALSRAAFWGLVVFHSVLLPFTVLDHETMRFLGMHLDLSLLGTYGNAASIREVLKFLASDLSVPYLPYLLFFGCIPLAFALFHRFRRFGWARSPRLGRVPLAMAALAAAAFVFLNYIWTGGFRMRKLRPFISTLESGMAMKMAAAPATGSMTDLSGVFRREWMLEQGDSVYVFPDSGLPFYKVPLREACARGSVPGDRCAVDADGDGFPAASDCDDADRLAYPGAADRAGDGFDQDCDGIDASPPNFIIVIMESHRGENAGYLRPFGALPGLPDSVDPTPAMDALVRGGAHAWTRFICSGVPTINALMSSHLSILQHPNRYIANDFTTLRNRSFTEELARRGYATRFFSAADPAWDNQVPWLRQWYQGIRYDRGRETDAAMFADMARWMADSLDPVKPFLVTAMTKTNHYPFNPEPGVPPTPPSADLAERMRATMRYTDSAMGAFLDSVRHRPWFGNTLVVLMADHGFPLSEHGSSTIGYGLYSETIWIPFVIAGKHPRLGPGALHDYPASQLDLGPTILDLAGIRTANHYLGHSLVRPATGLRSTSLVVRGEQGAFERGEHRIHGPLGDRPREQGVEVFNVVRDPGERDNLYPADPAAKAVYDSLAPILRAYSDLNTYAVEANLFWPDSTARPQAAEPPGEFVRRPGGPAAKGLSQP